VKEFLNSIDNTDIVTISGAVLSMVGGILTRLNWNKSAVYARIGVVMLLIGLTALAVGLTGYIG
jgi:hypothetical protein